MSKFYTVKKEIGGVEYTAQFNGLSAALKAIDNSYIDGTNTTSLTKLSTYLLENVLVEPKVTVDDFEDMAVFNEVIAFLREVMSGEFREANNEKPSTGKGKK